MLEVYHRSQSSKDFFQVNLSAMMFSVINHCVTSGIDSTIWVSITYKVGNDYTWAKPCKENVKTVTNKFTICSVISHKVTSAWFSCRSYILVQLEFRNVGLWEGNRTREPGKKALVARYQAGIKPEPHGGGWVFSQPHHPCQLLPIIMTLGRTQMLTLQSSVHHTITVYVSQTNFKTSM